MSPSDQALLEKLKILLAARDGKPGYKVNVVLVRQRIADIERRNSVPTSDDGA